MKVVVSELNEKTSVVPVTLAVDWLQTVLDCQSESEMQALQELGISFRLQRFGLDVFLQSSFVLCLRSSCSACLETFDLEVPISFSITIKPRSADPMPASEEVVLSKEDMDEKFYENDYIDLLDLLREEIILSLPMYPRCSDNCRGLCVLCGANLNQTECGCQREEIDPRWSVLKSFEKHRQDR